MIVLYYIDVTLFERRILLSSHPDARLKTWDLLKAGIPGPELRTSRPINTPSAVNG